MKTKDIQYRLIVHILCCTLILCCVRSDDLSDDENKTPCTTSNGEEAFCRPPGQCHGLSYQEQRDNVCTLDIGTGFCCLDQAEPTSEIKIANLYATNLPELEQFSIGDINSIIDSQPQSFGIDGEEVFIGEDQVKFFIDSGDNEKGSSPPLFHDGFDLSQEIDYEEEESPTLLHNLFNKPKKGTKNLNEEAEMFITITEQVGNDITEAEIIGLRKFDSDTVESIRSRCPWIPEPKCDKKLKYRTYDGSCNNLKNSNYGRSMTPYQRLLFPLYEKGFKLPRTRQTNGQPLPSARVVSLQATGNEEREDYINVVLLMQMGQFIDHDLTHTPFKNAECCTHDNKIPLFNDPNECFPIEIPNNDPFWKGSRTCMTFSRSLKSPNLKCNLESGQQTNQITHWLDGSNIYGSSDEEAEELKDEHGLLKFSFQRGTLHGSLPSCKEADGHIEGCLFCPKVNRDSCYFAGDGRVNEQPALAVMHTLWMREHNRIANTLSRLNPKWKPEKLFEEARKITIAEYQHVIYSEWLPIVLGKDDMTKNDLWPRSKGFFTRYNDTNFDPRITNEFSTAAFRFGHSLIPKNFLAIIDPRGRSTSSEALRTLFFKPERLQDPGMIDGFLRGMTTENMMEWDSNFIEDIQNHLFETETNQGGLDLIALNVQRGRDHGIPGYNAYRKFCGMKQATNFDDLEDTIYSGHVEKLKQIYDSVDDIDLFIGGIMEYSRSGLLGGVFSCIIGDQFSRLKYGDRFFYERKDEVTGFTERQLREIKKTTMSRIICDNSDINKIQLFAFRAPNIDQNKVVDCNSGNILKMDLEPFTEVSKECLTAIKGEQCKFPFVYNGIKHEACTFAETTNSRPWCALETYGPNNTVVNNKWDDCGPGCPVEHMECKTVDGETCIFPFIYENKRHTTCTKQNSKNGKAWCATELDVQGHVIENKWGDCSEDC